MSKSNDTEHLFFDAKALLTDIGYELFERGWIWFHLAKEMELGEVAQREFMHTEWDNMPEQWLQKICTILDLDYAAYFKSEPAQE